VKKSVSFESRVPVQTRTPNFRNESYWTFQARAELVCCNPTSGSAERSQILRHRANSGNSSAGLGEPHIGGQLFAAIARDADAEYGAALRLSPQFTPAAVNLADLYRQQGRDGDGESVLRSAIARVPNDEGHRHAVGLAFIRLIQLDEALNELRQSAELGADQPPYIYVFAVAFCIRLAAAEFKNASDTAIHVTIQHRTIRTMHEKVIGRDFFSNLSQLRDRNVRFWFPAGTFLMRSGDG
jgi:tetratricopeptide (TPR) repeat protein